MARLAKHNNTCSLPHLQTVVWYTSVHCLRGGSRNLRSNPLPPHPRREKDSIDEIEHVIRPAQICRILISETLPFSVVLGTVIREMCLASGARLSRNKSDRARGWTTQDSSCTMTLHRGSTGRCAWRVRACMRAAWFLKVVRGTSRSLRACQGQCSSDSTHRSTAAAAAPYFWRRSVSSTQKEQLYGTPVVRARPILSVDPAPPSRLRNATVLVV